MVVVFCCYMYALCDAALVTGIVTVDNENRHCYRNTTRHCAYSIADTVANMNLSYFIFTRIQ